jgi:hypothetical protein
MFHVIVMSGSNNLPDILYSIRPEKRLEMTIFATSIGHIVNPFITHMLLLKIVI